MEELEIDSAMIRSIAYDDGARTCDVRFTSGRVYRYSDVPREVFDWWSRTPSKGAFFNRKVRDVYPFHELPDPEVVGQDLVALLEASVDPPEEPS